MPFSHGYENTKTHDLTDHQLIIFYCLLLPWEDLNKCREDPDSCALITLLFALLRASSASVISLILL